MHANAHLRECLLRVGRIARRDGEEATVEVCGAAGCAAASELVPGESRPTTTSQRRPKERQDNADILDE
jgi:hypothetical protein